MWAGFGLAGFGLAGFGLAGSSLARFEWCSGGLGVGMSAHNCVQLINATP